LGRPGDCLLRDDQRLRDTGFRRRPSVFVEDAVPRAAVLSIHDRGYDDSVLESGGEGASALRLRVWRVVGMMRSLGRGFRGTDRGLG
jgi:hypothetical protein